LIAFYVQGGGLGHLSRTHRLIQHLQIKPEEVLIISPSSFKNYFKHYQFITISWNDNPVNWSKILLHQLTKHAIKRCFVDAFPLGIKGELIPVYKAFPEIAFIYTCRILKWKKYMSAMPESFIPNFKKTIVLEELYEEHFNWVKDTSQEIDCIQLFIELPKKHLQLVDTPYILVIHSGGKNDVVDLCKKVAANVTNTATPIFVFTQVSVVFDDKRFKFRVNEYPIEQYFRHATHIYTAAGFNLINELVAYHKKHTIFPIDRLYDDQVFRTQNRTTFF